MDHVVPWDIYESPLSPVLIKPSFAAQLDPYGMQPSLEKTATNWTACIFEKADKTGSQNRPIKCTETNKKRQPKGGINKQPSNKRKGRIPRKRAK